jgi:hypothetical protein
MNTVCRFAVFRDRVQFAEPVDRLPFTVTVHAGRFLCPLTVDR